MRLNLLFEMAGLRTVFPAAAVGLLGLSALAWLMLSAQPSKTQLATRQFVSVTKGAAQQLGVVFPPWTQGGLSAAAAIGLPIMDLRWGGNLAIFDTSGQPELRQILQRAGYFVINTAIPAICFSKDAPRV